MLTLGVGGALHGQIVSDFSIGIDGWSTFGDYGGAAPGTPIYSATGGYPSGGCIKQTDNTVGIWYWYGPAKFRGVLSDYYDCELKFDLKTNHIQFPVDGYDVMIFNNSGDTMVLYTLNGPTPINTWNHYTVLLSTGVGWKYGSTAGSPNLTAVQLAAILADVKRIRIRAEYEGLFSETNNLDNVTLTCGAILLPVEISFFTATEAGFQTSRLDWTTQTETNCNYFQVEKSVNGLDFDSIGLVYGAGTTNVTQQYVFYDDNFTSTCYYRLKQRDFSGKTGYSDVVSLESKLKYIKNTQIYPNPTTDNLSLTATENSKLRRFEITDITGRILVHEQIEPFTGLYSISIPVSFLAPGMYIINCYTISGVESQKFEIIK